MSLRRQNRTSGDDLRNQYILTLISEKLVENLNLTFGFQLLIYLLPAPTPFRKRQGTISSHSTVIPRPTGDWVPWLELLIQYVLESPNISKMLSWGLCKSLTLTFELWPLLLGRWRVMRHVKFWLAAVKSQVAVYQMMSWPTGEGTL